MQTNYFVISPLLTTESISVIVSVFMGPSSTRIYYDVIANCTNYDA